MKREHPELPTVLIVEDEVGLAELYELWLQDDYQVRTAFDGEEALESIDESVNVVLLDRRLPDFSGDDVLGRIRKQGFDCRVAIVSAVQPDFDIIEMGFDEYVKKPATKDDLKAVIEQLLTRAEYDSGVQEYFALIAKRATIEAEKTGTELSNNHRYTTLTSDIEAMAIELDQSLSGLDATGYEAAFRDLGDQSDKQDDDGNMSGRG